MINHHSVRKYVPGPLPEEDLHAVLVAAQSAPTSSGQHAWSVVIVEQDARKQELSSLTGRGNPFIAEAGAFLVFCGDLSRQAWLAEQQEVTLPALDYQEALLVATVDASLAAQNAVVAAESLGYGTCYVGGIRTNLTEVCSLLDLPPYAFPLVGLAIGYRSQEDQATVRPRLPLTALAHKETYSQTMSQSGIDSLERANREYFEQQGRPQVSWKERSVRRWLSTESSNKRLANRERIAERGFLDR